jgi:Immunoglobulin-like domain of bacterial spore germination
MGLITSVRVRQPANDDLVGRVFVVAGIGAGFEGTIGIRLLNPQGKVLATGSAQSRGGGIGVGEFVTTLEVNRPPRAGARCTLQVFGDNPGLPDEGPSPGFNLQQVRVIMFPDLAGWLLYRVEPGDSLTGICPQDARLRPIHGRADRGRQPPHHRPGPHRDRLAATDPAQALTSRDCPSTRQPDQANHAIGRARPRVCCRGTPASI